VAQKSATMRSLSGKPADPDMPVPDDLRPPRESSEATATEALTGEVASKTPAINALMEWLANMCEVAEEDTQAGLESIVRQMLEAPDMASVLRQTMPQSGKDFVDVPMLWTGVRIIPSDYEDGGGAPYYASMSVMVGEPPEPRVINCGGWRVLAQVMRQVESDEWPKVVMIREMAKAKGKKNPPLGLVEVDALGNPIAG
jgi:hypothetical protein